MRYCTHWFKRGIVKNHVRRAIPEKIKKFKGRNVSAKYISNSFVEKPDKISYMYTFLANFEWLSSMEEIYQYKKNIRHLNITDAQRDHKRLIFN